MTLRRREKLTSEDWRVFHVSFLFVYWTDYKGFLPGYETGRRAFLYINIYRLRDKQSAFLPRQITSRKEENIMRKEFYIGTNEDITDYMERAASYIRSIKQGRKLADGRDLSVELTIAEQKELMQYVYGMAIEIMNKTSGKYALNRNDFGSYREDFINNYAEVIMKRLDLFKDPTHVTVDSKSYRFPTFLSRLSGEAILRTYAQIHGVSPKVERRMYRVISAVRRIATDKQKNSYDVTPSEIHEICEDISVNDIISILNYLNKSSLNQMMGDDNLEGDAFIGDDGIETDVVDVLDVDTERVLNGFLDRLSDLEKLFVLIRVRCCDETYAKMTAEELSVNPLVIAIVAADKKLSKNIAVGDIKISRPRRSSAAGNTSIEMRGVEIVSYNVIRYHREKAGNYLKSLESSINMEDICGRCGIKYFIDEWNSLIEKYM